MLKSGDLGPTGLVVGQSGWEAQNRENPTRSGDITCMSLLSFHFTALFVYIKQTQSISSALLWQNFGQNPAHFHGYPLPSTGGGGAVVTND